MGTRDPRVDAYIEAAPDFAKPILRHLREVVHGAEPDLVEDIKWRFPVFLRRGIVCHMAAFKQYCAFGFWKEKLLFPDGAPKEGAGMGQLGRITSLADLPPDDELSGWIREAVRLDETGAKVPKAAPRRQEVEIPESFQRALEQRPEVRAAFDAFPPSHRREYIEWIADAKREETRERRIATALEWIGEGKSRNWKYSKGKESGG